MQTRVKENRAETKWKAWEQVGRVLWAFASPLFRLSPRPMWGWRRLILRGFGARIGREVHIYPNVRITIPWHVSIGDFSAIGDGVKLYALGKIEIGSRVTVSQGSHICAGTHDYRDPKMPLQKEPIIIGDDVWVCADVFVSSGLRLGTACICGSRAVVTKDVPPNVIVGGNPAKPIGERKWSET